MVYQMETNRGGVKLVDDLNFVYRIDRKYGEKSYWKCEYRECKARVHTVQEDDNLSMRKTFGEHCHPSHPSTVKVYEAKTELKLRAINSQTSARSLITEISSSLDDNVLARMPTSAHLSRNIRGWRQKKGQAPPIPTGRSGHIVPEEHPVPENDISPELFAQIAAQNESFFRKFLQTYISIQGKSFVKELVLSVCTVSDLADWLKDAVNRTTLTTDAVYTGTTVNAQMEALSKREQAAPYLIPPPRMVQGRPPDEAAQLCNPIIIQQAPGTHSFREKTDPVNFRGSSNEPFTFPDNRTEMFDYQDTGHLQDDKSFSQDSYMVKSSNALIQDASPGHVSPDRYCTVCRKEFTTSHNMRQHQKQVHMNLRNHICNYCGKKFKRVGHLRVHRKGVHGETEGIPSFDVPGMCPHCDVVIHNIVHFRRHVCKVHPTQCREMCNRCETGFLTTGDFVSHMRVCNPSVLTSTDYANMSMDEPSQSVDPSSETDIQAELYDDDDDESVTEVPVTPKEGEVEKMEMKTEPS